MRRAKITKLPPDVLKWLERTLSANGYSEYVVLEEELAARGFTISKSSIHRYGVKLQAKLQGIKDSTAMSALILEEAPDDADKRSGALMALTQTELFNIVLAIRELDDETDLLKRAKLLSALTGNISKLARSSVYQKKHELEIRARVAVAEKTITAAAKRTGASPELIKIVEQQLGILR